jgi:anthranilate synthase component 1
MKRMSYDEYSRFSDAGQLVPVYRQVPADLLTPVSAFMALQGRSQRAFLLESVLGGERVARYSFIGRDPVATIEVRGGKVLERDAEGVRSSPHDLLTTVRAKLPQGVPVAGLPRFTGGAVGYLTYDSIRLFERIPDRHPPTDLPIASFSLYRALVAFDHVQQKILLIANTEPGRKSSYGDALSVLDSLESDLRAFRIPPASDGPVPAPAQYPQSMGDGAAFREAVLRAKEYIAIGDIFQVVLSRQAKAPCNLDPFSVYRALRMVNPSPYMYFFKEEDRAIAGASPEILVRVEGGKAETRPIAGTRPRGVNEEEDRRLAEELLADDKERAEHIMLVDLGRNDLGRVCSFESVHVPDFMAVERYSHVMHIESSVHGKLREGKDALDALVATFPAGTLSGAPKIRAMEIIDELEPVRRGLYGGALGYIDLRGNLDFCIAIRTVTFEGGDATVQAGAGIVADSDPTAEQRETEAKSGAMFEALRMAAGFEGVRS